MYYVTLNDFHGAREVSRHRTYKAAAKAASWPTDCQCGGCAYVSADDKHIVSNDGWGQDLDVDGNPVSRRVE